MQRLKITIRTFALAVACLMAAAAPIITLGQVPPEEQNPWKCYDSEGWERECTVTEKFVKCVDSTVSAYRQCRKRADNGWERFLCKAAHQADVFECQTRYLKDFIL